MTFAIRVLCNSLKIIGTYKQRLTILIFNSLGYKLLKESYSIAKQSNLSISYEKAVDYLKVKIFSISCISLFFKF
jgi:hypothetical protein